MRMANSIRLMLAIVPGVLLATGNAPAQPGVPQTSAQQLVRQAVDNELKHNDQPMKFLFRDQKETPRGSQTKLVVETTEAMAGMLVAIDGKPLTAEQRSDEEDRLNRLAGNHDELRRKQRTEKEDTERTERMVKALPDAFLFERDGTEVGKEGVGVSGDDLVRLKFRPNPAYQPPSRTEQVLAGMQGYILVDENKMRIAKIDGTLIKDVAFGWGILGHLDKGGHFLVEQGEVSRGDWEITRMNLAFTGKILLFKSLNIKSNEVFADFQPVPSNLTFAQGVALLKKQSAQLAENTSRSNASQR